MRKFNRKLFSIEGEYIFYGNERKFVARFKHRGPFTKSKFLKELMKNHTVQEYFSKLESGIPPLVILREKNENWYYTILNNFKQKSLS